MPGARVKMTALARIAIAGAVVVIAPRARAQTTPENPKETPPTPAAALTAENLRFAKDLEGAAPPQPTIVYFQYGVAFTTKQVIAPGAICDNLTVPCILGGGGGIVLRGGWRSTGPLYIGAAYELTKQDPNKLYRIALLQQGRAEARYYLMTARVTAPYATMALGVAGYGNEWSVDTWGPLGSLGAGIEYQITRTTVVGLAINYSMLHTSRFMDTAGTARAPGIAQLFGLDLVLEQRDAIVTGSKPR